MTTLSADVKELIPEFYCTDPSFLLNLEKINFGARAGGREPPLFARISHAAYIPPLPPLYFGRSFQFYLLFLLVSCCWLTKLHSGIKWCVTECP